MAYCSSSSSSCFSSKYTVFLSFRGEETWKNFTSHLYDALSRENVTTFIDYKLNRGEEISPDRLTAIKQSKISVIIFSRGYGSSIGCVKELENILECKNRYGQIVIPVFYHVNPSDVRNQTGDFGEAFSKLEERLKVKDPEMLQRWKTALTDISNLSGFVSNNTRNESSLVNNIVEDILKKLNDEYSAFDNENLVGLDSKIEKIENLLSSSVRKLGIWGIGGIGKTTLAGVVFKKVSKQFEASYFIRNIGEELEKSEALNDLRQRLSSRVLGDKNPKFTLQRRMLGRVLIVFDDVTQLDQMECLMEDFDYQDSETQIIITTRDEEVLKECGVDPIHIIKMEELSSDEAFQLFNKYAFRESSPIEDYFELSSRVVAYAKGVPLALKILGSSLFKRTNQVWEDVYKNLKKSPCKDIKRILKVSYDGLDYKEQQAFLAACSFRGCERYLLEEVLDTCGFVSHSYINVLIERSLITTPSNIITMHDLLQEMGREIVQQESIDDPSKHSRLWNKKDIFSVLTKNTGKGATKSISLDKAREIQLQPKTSKKKDNLRFLEAYGLTHGNRVYGFEDPKSDFSELGYFCWFDYFAKSLLQNFDPENLATRYMTSCRVKRLWTSDKNLYNLKHTNLSNCKHPVEMPNLSLLGSASDHGNLMASCSSSFSGFSSFSPFSSFSYSSSFSSCSFVPKLKHKVFLSFRGEETRKNFTSHLYEAFSRENINTFIDDKLNRGEEISPALLTAIEQSKISVIIFSKGYGSSRWCLIELEKILECKNKYGQIVIPVFYHVNPSDVRNQTGDFGEAFSQLEDRFKVNDPEMFQRWKTALTDISNLSGFVSNNNRHESSLVNDIVEDILKKLNDEYSEFDNKNLVGLDSKIEKIENLLLSGVCKLGIWGIGGIGKTTLAGAVFKKISKQFEASYFIRNIREESEKSGGLNDLRQRLSSKVQVDKNPKFTLQRGRPGQVLIVFDDVNKLEQMECLMEDFDYWDSESRIIITTRDEEVLKECGVDPMHIIKMEELSSDEAFQLFNKYAFGECSPKEGYSELSSRAVAYAESVPLALKILGSSLFKRTKQDWEGVLQNMKKSPYMDIRRVIKVSYDGLDYKEQQVFLHIACFFRGCERYILEDVLDSCGFVSHNCINVLIKKSLITISSNIITIHDLLQEMGREIVRQESIDDPSKRSRLWDEKDIFSVLTKKTGKGAIQSISLDMSKSREIHLQPKAFKKMYNLRFLEAYGFTRGNKVYGFEDLKSDFSELRYLGWFNYSAKSLPQNFEPENLVALYMTCSKVNRLWTSVKNLYNLKHIDLSNCKHLIEMPNLSFSPNLESLILQGCTNLKKGFSSIRDLNKLVLLNLRECKNFECLPINPSWKCLQKLVLSECSNLKTVPFIPDTVEELYLDGTAIKELPSLKHLSSLKILSLENCLELESIPESISGSENLRVVILSNCSKIETVPYIPGSVEELYLDGTAIEELPPLEHISTLLKLSLKNCLRLKSLPESICEFKSLQYIYLSGSSKIDRLPDGLKNLKALKEIEVEGIGITNIPSLNLTCLNNLKKLSFPRCGLQKPPVSLLSQLPACHKLEHLNLEDCCIEMLPENLGELHSLTFLYLGGNNFETLPESIKGLSKLYELDLSNCRRLKSLPQLPDKSLRVKAKGCTSLETASGLPTQCLSMGTHNEEISFINCFNLKLNLTDTLPNIERNADLWFSSEEHLTSQSRVNLPKVYNLPKAYSLPKASVCYPGSKIPDWFIFTSQTGYIELPSDWLNDDLIGFAFCAVVSFRDYEEAEALQVRCFLVVNEEIISVGCLFNEERHKVIESEEATESGDHVFLGYYYEIMALELLTASLDSKGYMEFFVEHGSNNCRKKRKVKKCGVRLLYAKDKTAATVERDLRFPNVRSGCLRCYLFCCVKHEEMDESKAFEILDTWSSHSEIYKPPIRRDYSVHIGCKVLGHHQLRKRMDWFRP